MLRLPPYCRMAGNSRGPDALAPSHRRAPQGAAYVPVHAIVGKLRILRLPLMLQDAEANPANQRRLVRPAGVLAQGPEELAQPIPPREVLADVAALRPQVLQDRQQLHQLLVLAFAVPAPAEHAVVRVARHGDRRIVHQDALRHGPPEKRQLLEEGAAELRAVLPVEAVRDEGPRRVQGVDDLVGVRLLGGREDDELEGLRGDLEEKVDEGPEMHVAEGGLVKLDDEVRGPGG
mmetsp:Transcript_37744/g.112100  ORF Transcript_37744/g.112100 Transcript_37744/m.112100 type:complete len:233 (+) Transcript_37744:148-846(+)